MGRKWEKRRDDGGSMLASIVVIVLGTGLCCFLCLMDTSDLGTFLMVAMPIAGIILIGWIVRYRYGRGESGSLNFWHSAANNHYDDSIAAQYRPQKVKDRRANAPSGSNQPITAAEAHEIQVTSANSWVPSKTRPKNNLPPD